MNDIIVTLRFFDLVWDGLALARLHMVGGLEQRVAAVLCYNSMFGNRHSSDL